MTKYLRDIPLSQAKIVLDTALQANGRIGLLGTELLPVDEKALGRVLARPVWAKISSPHYHASAMDGYAVRSGTTNSALPSFPITLDIGTQAFYVDTGDVLPELADAVIPIENVDLILGQSEAIDQPGKPEAIQIRNAVTPWSNVRPMGEDIVASQLVLPAGHVLRPMDLGAIAASGHASVEVARSPKVAILPTGSELIPIGQPVKPGDIIEFNSISLAAQVLGWGAVPHRYPITRDEFELLCQRVFEASQENDLILLNAGSSAGSEDYSSKVVEELGDLLVHGVAIRPGHPVVIGMIGEKPHQIPIIGVPGYPVSALLTGEIFIEPLISRWLGRSPLTKPTISAALTRKVTSPSGDDDYMRVAVGRVGDKLLAAPLSRGAGVITSLVRADGVTVLPAGVQGLDAGSEVKVQLYRRIDEIDNTILVIGSHDITIDIMAQFLAEKNRRLTSANVGSMGGLIALNRGEAHLAGSHLLDPDTGEYNIKYIRQILPGIPVKLIALAGRQQGLMVAKDNPKQIFTLLDLAREDVTYVNRQSGAGTRVLLDYQLRQLKIPAASIKGYHQEEFTHLAVAAAVASGRADCGLGIAAAAQALELDFIPLYQERYDLVIPRRFYDDNLLEPLIRLLNDRDFRKAVSDLPGYNVEQMGQEIM